jgi:hypothetical protein
MEAGPHFPASYRYMEHNAWQEHSAISLMIVYDIVNLGVWQVWPEASHGTKGAVLRSLSQKSQARIYSRDEALVVRRSSMFILAIFHPRQINLDLI